MNIDFSKIRPYNGSQNFGFEELICQLARLQKPQNASHFIRKGLGGDAGVECYWVLTDESEICWQAKYFIDGMKSSQWTQLCNSFETALNKHPKLIKYIICLPFDKPDSRKQNKNKQSESFEDKWNEHVKKWKNLANEKNRNIEIEYWGKHEITNFLTIDDPEYSGKALFWFDETVLSSKKLEDLANRSRKTLGDRYTPEFHVNLPISKNLEAFCLHPQWWEDFRKKVQELNERSEDFFRGFIDSSDKDNIKKLQIQYSQLRDNLLNGLKHKNILSCINEIKKQIDSIEKNPDVLNFFINDELNNRRLFRRFSNALYQLSEFLDSKFLRAAKVGVALLYGDAGIGKSHLMCDIALYRVKNKLPIIFLLGSQYGGSDPISLIKNSLDLEHYTNSQVLGAIDALGERSGSRTLIMIDAINEGLHKEDWQNHLSGFLSQISQFKNIAILLSCRSTYLKYLLPDNIHKEMSGDQSLNSTNEESLVPIKHPGFQGCERRATEIYLSKQGISKPSMPVLYPEFTNPLFLKFDRMKNFEGHHLDILLKLSTEPSHPWNADFLHKSLVNKTMPERDSYWSTYLALNYTSESIIQDIIEWSHSGNIEKVEEERIRLCAIVLFWFLTTSNRRLRDRATKSLVRMLSQYPSLLLNLLCKFHSVNDLYLVERLYAVVYGVICNVSSDHQLISKIAEATFKFVFEDAKPHILLRDYARGILEFTLCKGLLPQHIKVQQFRPPYKSRWPIENPSNKQIEEIAGSISIIKHSVINGDFGKYIMRCVHDFSPTSLNQPFPETPEDLREKFAKEKLDKEDREEYDRWLSSLRNDPAEFSRKWAQRWVCQRAYQLGWSEKLFLNFERKIRNFQYTDRKTPLPERIERIGKKYQWIAFHELLAYLSDNVHFIGERFDDSNEQKYKGPWQIWVRDIDPTIWIRKNGEYKSSHNKSNTWWQPYQFSFHKIENIEDQKKYLWNKKQIPDFSKLLQIENPNNKNSWSVLSGYWHEQQKESIEDKDAPRLNGWFSIESICVPKKDCHLIEKNLENKYIASSEMLEFPSIDDQKFFGEHPWHFNCQLISGWGHLDINSIRSKYESLGSIRCFVPYLKYHWEQGNQDYSIDDTISFYTPPREFIKDLNLNRTSDFGSWQDKDNVVFCDPSIKEYGPSYALMESHKLKEWLAQKDLELFWLVSGEKELFSFSFKDGFYGIVTYKGLFKLVDEVPKGSIYFEEERPPVKINP